MHNQGLCDIDSDDERLRWLLTAKDISRRFQVKVTWIYGKCRSRAKDPLPFVKIGHYLRFEESAVRGYLNQHKKNYGANE